MTKQLKIINVHNELKNKFVEWHDKDNFIISDGNRLYFSNEKFCKINLIGEFTTNVIIKFLTNFPLFKRMFRYYYYNVYPLNEKRIFVTFRKSIGIFQNKKLFKITLGKQST